MSNGLSRKLALVALFCLLCLGLTACGEIVKEQPDDYRTKQLMAASFTSPADLDANNPANEAKKERLQTILLAQDWEHATLNDQPELARALAFAWGEGDLKYHVVLPGDQNSFVATAMSASTGLAYNYSYLINSPAKLLANIRWNFALAESDYSIKAIGYAGALTWSLLDVFYFLLGTTLASFIMPFAMLFGFLFHPIQTFIDLLPLIPGSIYTTIYAVTNFFY